MSFRFNRFCLTPLRYASGRQIILLLFYLSIGAFIVAIICKSTIYQKLFFDQSFQLSWKFWATIVHLMGWSLDSIVTIILFWIILHREPKRPLKILLVWQIPVGLPVITFEMVLSMCMVNVNSVNDLASVAIKCVYLLLRAYVTCIVYQCYRQLNSSIVNRLYEHCRKLEELQDFPRNNSITSTILESFLILSLDKKELKNRILNPLDLFIDKTTLGEGQYGQVYKGYWKKMKVAVKIHKNVSNCDESYFQMMLQEIKIRIIVAEHENIVGFFGVTSCSNAKEFGDPLCTIMEFCENGSLDNFLLENRATFVHQDLDMSNKSIGKVIVGSKLIYVNLEMHGTHTSLDLLRISTEVASGMEFLFSKNIVHGDLAARNVLLTSKLGAKLTDFGISRRLYNYEMYFRITKTQCLVPWRWMSIEALEDFKFSEKSDVWSYSVLLWEIFTLGEYPYKDIEWSVDIVNNLKNGLRLQKPEVAPSFIYELMHRCWKNKTDERPSFAEIRKYMEKYDLLS